MIRWEDVKIKIVKNQAAKPLIISKLIVNYKTFLTAVIQAPYYAEFIIESSLILIFSEFPFFESCAYPLYCYCFACRL